MALPGGARVPCYRASRFAALQGHKLLDAKRTELLVTGKTDTAPGDRYAYGLGVSSDAGLNCFGHGGGAPGMNGDLKSSCSPVTRPGGSFDPIRLVRATAWPATPGNPVNFHVARDGTPAASHPRMMFGDPIQSPLAAPSLGDLFESAKGTAAGIADGASGALADGSATGPYMPLSPPTALDGGGTPGGSGGGLMQDLGSPPGGAGGGLMPALTGGGGGGGGGGGDAARQLFDDMY